MKALSWISVVVCIIYGAIVFAAYEKRHAEALDESLNLRQVEATVISTRDAAGKVCAISPLLNTRSTETL